MDQKCDVFASDSLTELPFLSLALKNRPSGRLVSTLGSCPVVDKILT